jgi:NAD(P)-dependent dehydrogenase (short-subunit alcohol dehydrogenase family)
MPEDRGPFDLSGKVVVLTGGGGILGTRLTRALAAQGARVAVADRDPAKAAAAGGELAWGADVASAASLQKLRDQVREKLGEPDVLVNAVAHKSARFFEPFETFPLEDWNEVMAVNATGVMLACQAFGPDMARRGKGSIVNFLSIYGIVAPDPRIYEGSEYEGKAINTPAVYSASKAAVWGLTKYLAAYWGPRGVRVNAVTPGGVFSGQNETFVKRYSARVPMGRMAEKDEICGAVVFLASDASSYVTGQNLVVDGGLTAW